MRGYVVNFLLTLSNCRATNWRLLEVNGLALEVLVDFITSRQSQADGFPLRSVFKPS